MADEPIPPVETLDSAVGAAAEAIAALKRVKPQTHAEARSRTVELIRAQQAMSDASHAVADGKAAKRLNGNGKSTGGKHGGGLSELEIRALAKGLHGWLGPILKDIEKRLAELEARPTMTYEGTWDAERSYVRGMFVTNDGSLWHCEHPCTGVRPPTAEWTLAVKRGRDGFASSTASPLSRRASTSSSCAMLGRAGCNRVRSRTEGRA
jgi:hypothetical protein